MSGDGKVLVEPGTPIDLDNCAREPIHIPGSVQPRGALLVATDAELIIVQASANLPQLIDREVETALGAAVQDVLGAGAGAAIARVSTALGDLRERNPVEVDIVVRGQSILFDAILHRMDDGLLLIEIEPAEGLRPISFPNTYQAARLAVGELNRAVTLAELYDITARSVRDLTGFDRVMVYRYDGDYNGEVVAEAKRADLNSYLGQHYPASDIPVQARALYEKNWIRLISDVNYTPVPLMSANNPLDHAPLDLTHSTLRSVSPIHVEYLQNMGVHASMSISLLRDGKLWGLIACHHYAGPHTPPYAVRAAAEFLGSALSLRLVDRAVDEGLRLRLAAHAVLAKLVAAAMKESEPLALSLLGADLLDLVAADGVAVAIQGRYETRGTVPPESVVRALAGWAHNTGEDVIATDSITDSAPDVEVDAELASGLLALMLPDGQFVVWVRAEVAKAVDWGGDPRNKAIAIREGDGVRLSPRKSFARWREIVRMRSQPWTKYEHEIAGDLRRHVLESLYVRMRSEMRLAETLQRSLLPPMPTLSGWSISARYEPAAGGRIGGDWYDTFRLSDGRQAVVLGDVAGHGIGAAGTMAQLRNALRAYLVEGGEPGDAVRRLNRFAVGTIPGAFATLAVICVDLANGAAAGIAAGHPKPLLLSRTGPPRVAPVVTSPPLGVHDATFRTTEFSIPPGEGVVLFSDGMIERRDEDIETSFARFGQLIDALDDTPSAHDIFASVTRSTITDDATVTALYRAQ